MPLPATPLPMLAAGSSFARNSNVGRQRYAPSMAADASAYLPDSTAMVANTISSSSGFLGMGLFMGVPLLGGIIKGLEKAGNWLAGHVPAVGSPMAKTAGAMGKPFAFLNKTMEEAGFGKAVAVMDSFDKPATYAVQAFNDSTGWLSSRASSLIQKADAHAANAFHFANELHGVSGSLPAALAAKVTPLHGMISTAISSNDTKALSAHIGGLQSLARQHADKAVAKHAGKIETLAKKAIGARVKAEGLHDAAAGVSKMSVGQQTVGHTAANLAFVAGGAASAYLTAKDIYSDTRAYADMVADLTGKPARALGMFDLFMGELPYAAKIARNSMLINAGPRTLAEVANTVLNIKQLKGGFSMKLMAGAMLLPMMSQGVGLLTGGNILDAYKELKRNEIQGVENTAENYANLLGIASQELNKAGGATGDFTKAIAEQYAAQHLSVSEVMHRIGNGQVLKDLEAIQHQFVEEKNAQQMSHVEALTKKRELPEAKKPREVVGEHTKQVMHHAAQNAPEMRAV